MMTTAIQQYQPATLIERFGDNVKAIVGVKRKVEFANYGSSGMVSNYGYGYGGNWGDNYGSWGGNSPGATYDYRAAAGELWENRVVAACIQAIASALADAPPYLEHRTGNEWEKVDTHPIIELLNTPNGYHTSPALWGMVAGSEVTTGSAFWRIEKTRSGVPGEIWPEDPRRFRTLGNTGEFISGYAFISETGKEVPLANDEVVHFRYMLNPYNTRHGRTPLETGYRQVALDNGIATYHGSILRNSGVMSLLIAPEDAAAGAQLQPGAITEFVNLVKQRVYGDNAGAILGNSVPLKVQKMSYSPDEMAVDKLLAYAEASICALCGVDPMVVALGSGTQQKTYANMAEALNDFWERRIIPTKNRHSAELGAQLLPLFGLDPKDFRIAWDYSKVAALQENGDEKHARIRADFAAGGIDRATFKKALGYDVTPDDEGVYMKPQAGGDNAASADGTGDTQSMNNKAIKSADDEMPAALPDPLGVGFTDDELAALEETDSPEAVKLAMGRATPEKRALLDAKPVESQP